VDWSDRSRDLTAVPDWVERRTQSIRGKTVLAILARVTLPRRDSGRRAFWLTVAAFAWSLGLLVVGCVMLLDENGPRILPALAAPLALTTLTWLALNRGCTTENRAPRRLAWTLISLLGVFALIGGFSIGVFVLPIFGLLVAAAMSTPRSAQ